MPTITRSRRHFTHADHNIVLRILYGQELLAVLCIPLELPSLTLSCYWLGISISSNRDVCQKILWCLCCPECTRASATVIYEQLVTFSSGRYNVPASPDGGLVLHSPLHIFCLISITVSMPNRMTAWLIDWLPVSFQWGFRPNDRTFREWFVKNLRITVKGFHWLSLWKAFTVIP